MSKSTIKRSKCGPKWSQIIQNGSLKMVEKKYNKHGPKCSKKI